MKSRIGGYPASPLDMGGIISIGAEEILLESCAGIELRVADSGVGMKPDTIARAFDLFFTTKCDGLGGVGLPMVRRFVQEAGGRILIESEYGVGTTVTLQLPASPRPTDSHRESMREALAAEGLRTGSTGRPVLQSSSHSPLIRSTAKRAST